MHKVVTINLNGQAYQFDEDAYERIRAYLGRAEAQLHDNPDRAEILADLEQAIADKCAPLPERAQDGDCVTRNHAGARRNGTCRRHI